MSVYHLSLLSWREKGCRLLPVSQGGASSLWKVSLRFVVVDGWWFLLKVRRSEGERRVEFGGKGVRGEWKK